MKESEIKIVNRKLHYNYEVEKTICAGIMLVGSEVSSIRKRSVNISESFCIFQNNELYVKNINISNTTFGRTHVETRDRKLLLKKSELKQIRKWIEEKGNTVVPNYFLIPMGGFIKLYISLCKGKHDYDKRETIKKRDLEREIRNGEF